MSKTVIKNVKQHSSVLLSEQIQELQIILLKYNKVRSYVFSRYGSISGLCYLQYPREVRDGWVKTNFGEQWGLPPKYWKCALEDAFNTIKANWEASKVRIKKQILKSQLTEDEKSYACYVIQVNKFLYAVLHQQDFILPTKLLQLNIIQEKVHSFICRAVRKQKFSIPKAINGKSMMIDENMYSYKCKSHHMGIQGLIRGKQIKFNTRDKRKFTGNINIIIRDSHIEIHKASKVKIKNPSKIENIIAIDKGFKSLIATNVSEATQYGNDFSKLLMTKSDKLSNKNKQRNKAIKPSYWKLSQVKVKV